MYQPEQCKKKCEWMTCFAGMGLAGNGVCFLSGAWWMPSCPEFKDEEQQLRELEQIERGAWNEKVREN